jgi:cyclophilin family peptidyl-prolyl cis-trans isomerase
MNVIQKSQILFFFLLVMISCNNVANNQGTFVSIKTTLGVIKVRLYDETPIHRDNFIRLVNSQFYEGIIFHRVIKGFMIQAGDGSIRLSSSKHFNDTLDKYTIPSEFQNQLFHKKGALAAARQGNEVNPEMRSSGTQFYIVQGVKYSDNDLTLIEQRINSNIKQSIFNKFLKQTSDSIGLTGKPTINGQVQDIASMKMFQYLSNNKDYKIPEDQRNIYKSIGGAPFLDGSYTVFGEVTEGLDVVDKITSVSTDSNDKPFNDIKIIKIKIFRK